MFSFRSKNCSGWVGGLGIRGPEAVYVEIQFNISLMADGVDGRYSCQTKPSLLQFSNFNTTLTMKIVDVSSAGLESGL